MQELKKETKNRKMSVCYDNTMTEVDSIKYKNVLIIPNAPVESLDMGFESEVDSSIGSSGTAIESTMARMDCAKRVSFTCPPRG